LGRVSSSFSMWRLKASGAMPSNSQISSWHDYKLSRCERVQVALSEMCGKGEGMIVV
jgi:hypothetical protein